LVSGKRLVALGKPRLKLRVISRASQAAFAIIVNASVDLLFAFNDGEHFVNHSSTLHARNAFALAALICPPKPVVSPEATVRLTEAQSIVEIPKAGTELHAGFAAPAITV
jgi:hypothetical protein